MAEPIPYTHNNIHAEAPEIREVPLRELLEGVKAGSGEALTVILERANTPSTRSMLVAVAILIRGIGALREPAATSIERAIKASLAVHEAARTPSWLDLLRQARKPSTRRGLSIAIAALRGLGGEDVTAP